MTHMPKISEPLVFEYKVRPYGPSPAHCDCYDVNVETLPPAAVGQNSAVAMGYAATNRRKSWSREYSGTPTLSIWRENEERIAELLARPASVHR